MRKKKKQEKKQAGMRTATAIVMGGLVVSFGVMFVGETLHGIKKIITKPIFRKRDKNVGCSTDIY